MKKTKFVIVFMMWVFVMAFIIGLMVKSTGIEEKKEVKKRFKWLTGQPSVFMVSSGYDLRVLNVKVKM